LAAKLLREKIYPKSIFTFFVMKYLLLHKKVDR
jgi:hypothetical protein